MLTREFPIIVNHPDPPIVVTGRISPDSESVLILEFKVEETGQKLCTAVLLQAHMELTVRPESDTAFYSTFFPNGTVEIDYGYHYHGPEGKSRSIAIITTRSAHGEVLQRPHGLGW